MNKKTLFWFRQDLRAFDNPGLYEACQRGEVLAIYIDYDLDEEQLKIGGASKWWLHHSLNALNKKLGGQLNVYQGEPEKILNHLLEKFNIDTVYWNRCYEPARIKDDKKLKEHLKSKGIQCQSFNASLLWEPWQVLKNDGNPYKVFTPFFRKGCLNAQSPREVIPTPSFKNLLKDPASLTIEKLGLMPSIHWYKTMEEHWTIGEEGAKESFQEFLEDGIKGYKEGRNFPAQNHVSRLSPHLHFGEISPHFIWHTLKKNMNTHQTYLSDVDNFLSELGWREFSYYLLYHFPTLPKDNFQKKFDHFPWKNNTDHLKAWQKGQTGYPIVDAGMRELWQTGYMHNRVRMIVGSFLVKNLLLHWHHGAKWFWDCLLDADLANNNASWQWVAGSGADASPYFRIFNPVTQGEKFDPDGIYIKTYVPELEKLPTKYLFHPWKTPELILKSSGVELGKTYPYPIVDLEKSRNAALSAFRSISTKTSEE